MVFSDNLSYDFGQSCLYLQPAFAKASAGKPDKRFGAVAQSVEQRTENPCVGGSIPPHTTSTK